jgi:HEAT repeat protein
MPEFMNNLGTLSGIAAATTVLSSTSLAAGSVDDLIAKIKSPDDSVRGPAWQGAATAGAPAIKPLAGLMTDSNFEVARSARRAVWRIVRHAGSPATNRERQAVQTELLALLKDQPTPVRCEVLWMLSEIADENAVAPMAALLSDPNTREDARCALMRIPGKQVTKAFNNAFKTAPEDFKFALAETLRKRGETVKGYPSKKLTPTKQTTVGPSAKT